MTYSSIYQKRDAIAKFARWNMYKLEAKNPVTNPVWTLRGELVSTNPDISELVNWTVAEIKTWTEIDIEVIEAKRVAVPGGFIIEIKFKVEGDQRCSCGSMLNLREVGVRPGHPYYLCPRCFAEESLQ
jgi:hypothetical protein